MPRSAEPSSSPDDALVALRRALLRFPSITSDARLCRRVMGDLLPGDMGLVAALAALVEAGLPARLADGGSDAAVVTARTIEAAVEHHGLQLPLVRRASDCWLMATQPEPAVTAPLAAPAMFAAETLPRVAAAATRVREQEDRPSPPPRSSNRPRLAAGAAAIVVVVSAGAVALSLLHGSSATAGTGSDGVRTVAAPTASRAPVAAAVPLLAASKTAHGAATAPPATPWWSAGAGDAATSDRSFASASGGTAGGPTGGASDSTSGAPTDGTSGGPTDGTTGEPTGGTSGEPTDGTSGEPTDGTTDQPTDGPTGGTTTSTPPDSPTDGPTDGTDTSAPADSPSPTDSSTTP